MNQRDGKNFKDFFKINYQNYLQGLTQIYGGLMVIGNIVLKSGKAVK